jgi:hypothetical protein
MYTYIMYITLSYRCILCIEIAYTNCLTSSSNIYIGKTPVPNSGALSGHLFTNRKLYYSGSLSLNKSINLTSIGL